MGRAKITCCRCNKRGTLPICAWWGNWVVFDWGMLWIKMEAKTKEALCDSCRTELLAKASKELLNEQA